MSRKDRIAHGSERTPGGARVSVAANKAGRLESPLHGGSQRAPHVGYLRRRDIAIPVVTKTVDPGGRYPGNPTRKRFLFEIPGAHMVLPDAFPNRESSQRSGYELEKNVLTRSCLPDSSHPEKADQAAARDLLGRCVGTPRRYSSAISSAFTRLPAPSRTKEAASTAGALSGWELDEQLQETLPLRQNGNRLAWRKPA